MQRQVERWSQLAFCFGGTDYWCPQKHGIEPSNIEWNV